MAKPAGPIIAHGATGPVIGATVVAGYHGSAQAGKGGSAQAGDYGSISIRWYDGTRYRLAVGYVGEDGIMPNTMYHVVGGKLVQKGATT